MLAALLQGGSKWQNLPECYGTVTIRIQETDMTIITEDTNEVIIDLHAYWDLNVT